MITDDGGKTWTKTTTFPGVPEYTYVSDICPSRFDENVVFASFNNLKSDDFKPYLLKSGDKGKTWISISGDLPEDQGIYTVIQDPVKENILFSGTEFGIYATLDGGRHWVKFGAGLPDIAVRDIAIQERENDLVIATFGRGFYIVDNYAPVRDVTVSILENDEAKLFSVKDALMYISEGSRYGTGAAYYQAPNPEFGTVFTYYLKEVPTSLKSERIKKEKELFKKGEPIPTPTREELDAEKKETGPYLIFTIKDENGNIVRNLYENASAGINRVNWNLRYNSINPIRLDNDKYNPKKEQGTSLRALPGKYSVEMAMYHNGEITDLAGPVDFNTVVLSNTTLPAKDKVAAQEFYKKVGELWRVMSGTERYLNELETKTAYIQQALQTVNDAPQDMKNEAQQIEYDLQNIEFIFDGTPARASWEEVPPENMPLSVRMGEIAWASWSSTSAPTTTQKTNYEVVKQELVPVLENLKSIDEKLTTLQTELDKMKAPYTPGRVPKF